MALPENFIKLEFYALHMTMEGQSCYTYCEGRSAGEARRITERAWGKPWRAVNVFPVPDFHIVTDAATSEEMSALNELRRQNLIKANQKRLMTPDGEFSSGKEACKHLKISPGTLRNRLLSHPEQYYYVAKSQQPEPEPELEPELGDVLEFEEEELDLDLDLDLEIEEERLDLDNQTD